MARKLCFFGVLLVLSGSAGLGCTKSVVHQNQPPDPLLVSVHVNNKTVADANKSSTGVQTATAQYPQPPALPDTSVAAKKSD